MKQQQQENRLIAQASDGRARNLLGHIRSKCWVMTASVTHGQGCRAGGMQAMHLL